MAVPPFVRRRPLAFPPVRFPRVGMGRAAAVIAAIATVAAGTVASASVATAAVPQGFHPVAPARLMDSRIDLGTTGGPLNGGETRELQVGGAGGVPADAVAVVLNVTVTEPTAPSFVTVWPAGAAKPLASNLNVIAGQTVPNMVTVGLGAGGRVALFNNAGQAQIVVDVAGWYSSGFHPLVPARLLDTRNGPAPFATAETRSLPVAGAGGVPAAATAVALNVTVTDPTASGFVTVWPAGAAQPVASNLNFVPGQTVPNMVTVGLGAAGAVQVFNSNGNTQVIVDVAGWFDGGYHPLVPSRIMDTREARCLARLGPGESRLMAVAGQGGVPADGVSAVALNVTVTNATLATFVSLYPSNAAPAPGQYTSNLNVAVGTVPNMVTVGVGTDGRVGIYNNRGVIDVIVDVMGYYDGAAGSITAAATCDALGFGPQPPMANLTTPGAHDALVPATFGSGAAAVGPAQTRLAELGFWVPGTDGGYDYATSQAVMAFQKSVGVRASGALDAYTALLAEMQSIQPTAQSTTGDLVEVDKGRQLWFLVRGGKTVLTVNTSTGSDVAYTEVDQTHGGTTSGDAHTPEGRFKVYREYSDGWEHGQLGDLYRPRYFKDGAAVHGAPVVPSYPASHGCIRVSTAFMDHVWADDLMPHGSEVWVHN